MTTTAPQSNSYGSYKPSTRYLAFALAVSAAFGGCIQKAGKSAEDGALSWNKTDVAIQCPPERPQYDGQKFSAVQFGIASCVDFEDNGREFISTWEKQSLGAKDSKLSLADATQEEKDEAKAKLMEKFPNLRGEKLRKSIMENSGAAENAEYLTGVQIYNLMRYLGYDRLSATRRAARAAAVYDKNSDGKASIEEIDGMLKDLDLGP